MMKLLTDEEVLIPHLAQAIFASFLECDKCPFEKVCIAKRIGEEKSHINCAAYVELVAQKNQDEIIGNLSKEGVKKIIEKWVLIKQKIDEQKEGGNNGETKKV